VSQLTKGAIRGYFPGPRDPLTTRRNEITCVSTEQNALHVTAIEQASDLAATTGFPYANGRIRPNRGEAASILAENHVFHASLSNQAEQLAAATHVPYL